MALIDQDATIRELVKLHEETGVKTAQAIRVVREMPEVQPERKHGRFIGTEYDGYADGSPVYYEWECSECGCVFEDEEPTYNFCPNCGADMREKESDNG